jgi:peptidoglycan/xylan/chitin deacetylase (PgdA/CDA1 family)
VDRRRFLSGLLAVAGCRSALPAGEGHAPATVRRDADVPRLAFTLDDPHSQPTPRLEPVARDRAILSALERYRVRAALFVCGKRVNDTAGTALLERWNAAGHLLGNHSYSHLDLHSSKVTPEAYLADLEKGEERVRPFRSFQRYFRYPFLKEGNTREKRDAVRSYLREHGYRVGHVTVDASDWYVDERLGKRLAGEPGADLGPYRDFYLAHLWDRASYYDDLCRQVLGRSIEHTILLHHSLLNALFLGDVLEMFRSRGWVLVSAEEAFTTPVFSQQPDVVPAGESLIWQMAKATGGFDKQLRYPGEDGDYEAPKMDALGL